VTAAAPFRTRLILEGGDLGPEAVELGEDGVEIGRIRRGMEVAHPAR
jgi:hypothetical protein